MEALEDMGAFLRQQRSFTVHTTTRTDYELDSGQKVQLAEQGELRVRRPDHLRADVTSDRKQRQFFYDGKTFTIYAPRIGYYAKLPAPATILELADLLQQRYGLELPMVDLFRWGTSESSIGDITAATYIGEAMIDGVPTDQYAFRQPGLDWQIWIERGPRPLPRRILLTTTDDPARPERDVEMTWRLDTKHPAGVFAFVPAEDSREISIAQAGGTCQVATRNPRRPSKEGRHAP